ncbi:hypothetical protein [Breoghania sp.]|uniref:hypothetical protein n=1 Tax=Breoghania sp. TaxID=2065378 RepID=UPI00261EC89A|nr:hypothetical protein [Breoghania sp.]MDJ0933438.1 hypothetical protein [Breoghania sp.]
MMTVEFKEVSNIIHAGGGSYVIITHGPGNLIFGYYYTSLLDLSVAAFFPATVQSISLNEILGLAIEDPKSKTAKAARFLAYICRPSSISA